MLEVLSYAQKNGFDILHSHGYKGDVAFGFLPRGVRKIPLVSTLHGWTSTGGLSKNRIYEWLQRKSLKHIDAVVLVHRGMLSNPELKKVRGVHFHIVNNAIPFDPATQQTQQTQQTLDRTIVQFCQQDFTLGSIGRLSPEKGYNYLIEALDRLVKDGLDARLVIIGEGGERGSLERLASELGIADRVLLPGYRDGAKRYLPLFNVFVLSSLTEGLPITLLEAMRAGTPVAATRVGGIPDVLGEAGILVQPESPVALAEAIGRIQGNEALASRLSAAARRALKVRFSSPVMASGYLKIYQSVLSSDSPLHDFAI
jgi:glycosyltransferase involved in cell wall biosynthesis